MAEQPQGAAGVVAPVAPKPITGSPESVAQHALSIDPETGLPRGEGSPASTAAVLSLVCGFLFFLPLTGLPAIVAGVVALRAARRDPAHVGGTGWGVAGIILGVFNLVLTVGVVLVLAIGAVT